MTFGGFGLCGSVGIRFGCMVRTQEVVQRFQGCRSGARAVHSGCRGLGGHRETVGPGQWAQVVAASDGCVCRGNSQNM